MGDQSFANTITAIDLGETASSVMSSCEKYGMTWGCDTECPVLMAGNCELKDDENKNLWEEVKPRFDDVSCSSCGEGFGPGDNGFSHCESHAGMKPVN